MHLHLQTLAWAFALGVLCRQFIRLWTDTPYDRDRRHRATWFDRVRARVARRR